MKHFKLTFLFTLCVTLAMFFWGGVSQAETIRLTWDHDLIDLAGFKIYMESEAEVPGCPNAPDAGNMILDLPYTAGEPLTTEYQLIGLQNETFHFVITAYDAVGNESACSDEATYTVPDIPPTKPFSVTIEVVTTTTTTP